MRQNKEHKLVPEDAELFNAMRGNYFSNNERVFFERLQDKEEHEFTVSNDLLLYEGDNEEHIYIVRCEFEEYIVGHGIDGHYDEECHTMCLSDALRINLKTKEVFVLRGTSNMKTELYGRLTYLWGLAPLWASILCR